MFRKIMIYGVIAGLLVGIPLFGLTVGMDDHLPMEYGMLVGYLTMLIALSAVFLGVKSYRDKDLGGVIRFWPAFGMGLAISFVAGIFYILAWEAALAITQADFVGTYTAALIEQQKAKGVSGAELQKFIADMETFKQQYANPLFRIPMTFVEFFPVGLLVSLVSAGLLRNMRFLPARRD